jgi:MFS family permease
MAIHLWEPDTGPSVRRPQTEPVAADEGPFRLRQLLGICVVAAVVGVTFLTVPVHLGYLFALLHVTDSAQIGVAFALNSVGVILGSVAFGWVIGPRVRSVALQIALASGVLAFGFVGMSASANYGSLTIAAALSGIGMGLLLPTVNVWNMQVLPVSHRGVGIGAFQSSLFLGMFFNPILVVSLDPWSHSRAVSVGWLGLPLLFAAGIAVLVAVRARSAAVLSPSDA